MRHQLPLGGGLDAPELVHERRSLAELGVRHDCRSSITVSAQTRWPSAIRRGPRLRTASAKSAGRRRPRCTTTAPGGGFAVQVEGDDHARQHVDRIAARARGRRRPPSRARTRCSRSSAGRARSRSGIRGPRTAGRRARRCRVPRARRRAGRAAPHILPSKSPRPAEDRTQWSSSTPATASPTSTVGRLLQGAWLRGASAAADPRGGNQLFMGLPGDGERLELTLQLRRRLVRDRHGLRPHRDHGRRHGRRRSRSWRPRGSSPSGRSTR